MIFSASIDSIWFYVRSNGIREDVDEIRANENYQTTLTTVPLETESSNYDCHSTFANIFMTRIKIVMYNNSNVRIKMSLSPQKVDN